MPLIEEGPSSESPPSLFLAFVYCAQCSAQFRCPSGKPAAYRTQQYQYRYLETSTGLTAETRESIPSVPTAWISTSIIVSSFEIGHPNTAHPDPALCRPIRFDKRSGGQAWT